MDDHVFSFGRIPIQERIGEARRSRDFARTRSCPWTLGAEVGRLAFYDAVPLPGQSELLQPDILNPHYPDYYREPAAHPPSDDQNPIPVYFLAVAPGKKFEFRYRWRTFRGDPPAGDPEKAEGLRRVRAWLQDGLDHWGLGGKTAAGYGYFEVNREASEAERGEEEGRV